MALARAAAHIHAICRCVAVNFRRSTTCSGRLERTRPLCRCLPRHQQATRANHRYRASRGARRRVDVRTRRAPTPTPWEIPGRISLGTLGSQLRSRRAKRTGLRLRLLLARSGDRCMLPLLARRRH